MKLLNLNVICIINCTTSIKNLLKFGRLIFFNFKLQTTSLARKRTARFLLDGACDFYVSCVACVALAGNPALCSFISDVVGYFFSHRTSLVPIAGGPPTAFAPATCLVSVPAPRVSPDVIVVDWLLTCCRTASRCRPIRADWWRHQMRGVTSR